jgi:hypothetical protein
MDGEADGYCDPSTGVCLLPGAGAAARRAHRRRLPAADCRKIFADKKSGKDALRPELKACHAFLDAGDTLVVPSLDRYGRSLQDLINMVAELRTRGIGFTSPHESLDTTPRRPARLPRLRRARGVHPRTHRHRHQGGPGRRTRPRPGRRRLRMTAAD